MGVEQEPGDRQSDAERAELEAGAEKHAEALEEELLALDHRLGAAIESMRRSEADLADIKDRLGRKRFSVAWGSRDGDVSKYAERQSKIGREEVFALGRAESSAGDDLAADRRKYDEVKELRSEIKEQSQNAEWQPVPTEDNDATPAEHSDLSAEASAEVEEPARE